MAGFTTNYLFATPTPADPAQTNQWGTMENTGRTLVDLALGGVLAVSATGGNLVLTSTNGAVDQAKNAHFNFSGVLTSNQLVLWPAGCGRMFSLTNSCTGAYTFTIGVNDGSGSAAAGATVIVPQGATFLCYSDGTNVYLRQTGFTGTSLAITGNGSVSGTFTAGVLAVTGNGTVGGTLGVTGNVNVGGNVNGSGTVNATGNITSSTGDVVLAGARMNHDGGSGGAMILTGFGFGATYTWQDIESQSAFSVIAGGSGGVTLPIGATSWSAVSDERLKTDLVPIMGALEKLKTWRTYIGRLKTDAPEKRRLFLIAQDVQKTSPEAVWEDEHGVLHLSYTDTIPDIVAAIKELAALLEARS